MKYVTARHCAGQMFSVEVKEQSALALWSLAGQTVSQQRAIAKSIGIPMLIEILLRDSDKLQFVGMHILYSHFSFLYYYSEIY